MRKSFYAVKKNNIKFNRSDGFTLIEVVISIALLSLIALSVLPLFSYAARVLTLSEEKRSKIADGQEALHIAMALREGYWFSDGTFVELVDGDFPVKVKKNGIEIDKNMPGGIIKYEDLQVYLTDLPNFKLDPKALYEGYPPNHNTYQRIDIIGKNTNFSSNSNMKLTDIGGSLVSGFSYNINNKEQATIDIPTNLRHHKNPYMITIETGSEVVRNIFPVYQALAVIVGDGQPGRILISSDYLEGNYWLNVSADNPASHSLNDIFYFDDMKQYIAVGDNGTVLVYEEEDNWNALQNNVPTNNNLNSITCSSVGELLIVGDNGTIITALDTDSWVLIEDIPENNFNSITKGTINDEEVFVTVGSEGAVINNKGGEWAVVNNSTEESLNDVVYNSVHEKFAVVGDDMTILLSEDGVNWDEVNTNDSGNTDLYSVNWNPEWGDNGRYIAVGSNGKIFFSEDGDSWESKDSGVNNNLHDVIYWQSSEEPDSIIIIAIGDNGTILVSKDGENWNDVSSGVSDNLNSIAQR